MNSPAYSSVLRWRWSLSTLEPGLPNDRSRFPNPQQETDNMLPMENVSKVYMRPWITLRLGYLNRSRRSYLNLTWLLKFDMWLILRCVMCYGWKSAKDHDLLISWNQRLEKMLLMHFVALWLGFACVFLLTTNYRQGHNHILLKFTIKQLEIV